MKKSVIISLLVCTAGITLSAQTSNWSASGVFIQPDADTFIDSLGFDGDLDDSTGISIEWQTEPLGGFSFGLEYLYFGTDASISGFLTAGIANSINSTIGTSLSAGNVSLEEDYAAHAGFLNVSYFIDCSDALSLYAGAAIGFASITREITFAGVGGSIYDETSEDVFAYQFKVGLRYDLNENWALSSGVRYIRFNDVDFGYYDSSFDGAVALEAGLTFSY